MPIVKKKIDMDTLLKSKMIMAEPKTLAKISHKKSFNL
jgi:hypothetical protein